MLLFQSQFVDKEKVLVRLARQRKGKEPLTIVQGSHFLDVLVFVSFNNSLFYRLWPY